MDKLEFDIYPIIAQGMSSYQHWYTENVPVEDLAAVLAGMANSEGGSIYLGVNPSYFFILALKHEINGLAIGLLEKSNKLLKKKDLR